MYYIFILWKRKLGSTTSWGHAMSQWQGQGWTPGSIVQAYSCCLYLLIRNSGDSGTVPRSDALMAKGPTQGLTQGP